MMKPSNGQKGFPFKYRENISFYIPSQLSSPFFCLWSTFVSGTPQEPAFQWRFQNYSNKKYFKNIGFKNISLYFFKWVEAAVVRWRSMTRLVCGTLCASYLFVCFSMCIYIYLVTLWMCLNSDFDWCIWAAAYIWRLMCVSWRYDVCI